MSRRIALANVALLLLIFSCGRLVAQGTKADYQRIGEFTERASKLVYRTHIQPNWLHNGEHLWYRVQTGLQSHAFVFVDLQQQSRIAAFDHAKVAKQLANLAGKEIATDELPLTQISFSKDLQEVYFRWDQRDWKVRRSTSEVSLAEPTEIAAIQSERATTLRNSVDKGGELTVEFVNESSDAIRTVWIDRQGKRKPYTTIAAGENYKQHTFAGHVWLILNPAGEAMEVYEADPASPLVSVDGKRSWRLPAESGEQEQQQHSDKSPDGRFMALVRDHQLCVRDHESGEVVQLSASADENHFYADKQFFWSPDSRYLVALQVRPGEAREIAFIESSPADQLQPKLHKVPYTKPGDRIRVETPRLFDLKQQQQILLDASLYDTPWSVSRFRWKPDSSEFTFLYNERGHQTIRVIGINPRDGMARTIINEQADTFIDYTRKVYCRHLPESDEIVWMSERDGWNHLYLYDAASGAVKHQLTSGQWVVRGVDRVDVEKRQIWFRASGIVPDQDPYYVHHCRVDLDGKNLVILTEGDGTHSVSYSPNRKYLVDRYSHADQPEVTTVRRVSDGQLVCELEVGDDSDLRATGWQPAEPFVAKGRDGETNIYGLIYRPSNFNPDKRYPVIEKIYAGPHGSFVPKDYQPANRMQALAELGFIVVQIDGMGTSNRSKAFHDVCWKNLGDSGFPDRRLWLEAAAKKYPQLDLSRVGIYGGSAGGQSTLRALLAYGDFYHVGVADCGCHDNRMDKIWWNEQWMGWPIGPHYAEQSNVTQAHKLQGKLLLIVGELDRNVDPASTMQVVDALVKADKDFDLLVIPGAGHGAGSSEYGLRRTRDFFVRHLLGVEPRHK